MSWMAAPHRNEMDGGAPKENDEEHSGSLCDPEKDSWGRRRSRFLPGNASLSLRTFGTFQEDYRAPERWMIMDSNLPILNVSSPREPDPDPVAAGKKLAALKRELVPLVREGVLVAFSGGMDSACLLWASTLAKEEVEGGRVVALTATGPSTPTRDRADAQAFAGRLGVSHLWEESREMELPDYARNDGERCYHCKVELFRIARRVAEEQGLAWLLYGYNATDHLDDRPGHRAAMEAGARTPLSDVGLTKAEIRVLMEEAGLPLSGKPASPCLSSRVMTGIQISPAILRDVEEMEEILRRAGATTLRVRVCRDEARELFLRVEVAPGEMETALGCREELLREGMRRGYRWVTLDLGGYRTGGGVR